MKNKNKEQPIEEINRQEEVITPKPPKVVKLTEANLKKNEEIHSRAESVQSKTKPIWAKTAKELKEEEEQDIDNLIEFAYDLDYEKYMEDLEVRQALALIKDRVDELKQDKEWKEKAERDYR